MSNKNTSSDTLCNRVTNDDNIKLQALRLFTGLINADMLQLVDKSEEQENVSKKRTREEASEDDEEKEETDAPANKKPRISNSHGDNDSPVINFNTIDLKELKQIVSSPSLCSVTLQLQIAGGGYDFLKSYFLTILNAIQDREDKKKYSIAAKSKTSKSTMLSCNLNTTQRIEKAVEGFSHVNKNYPATITTTIQLLE
jgi:hypothetical protein